MRSARLRYRFIAAVLPLVLVTAGCSSTRTETEVGADRPRPAPAEKYPDFSAPLDSAMPQMSDDEAARQEKQLSALARERQSGRISESEYRRQVEELRRLGQTAQ